MGMPFGSKGRASSDEQCLSRPDVIQQQQQHDLIVLCSDFEEKGFCQKSEVV